MKTGKKVLHALLAALMLTGCGSSAASTAASATASSSPSETTAAAPSADTEVKAEAAAGQVDRIVIAVNSPATDASPFAMATPSRGYIHEALYGNLFFIEAGHLIDDIQPYIGKTLTQIDPFTYEIEMFDNVTDSKGNPIKAEDVVFSYETSFTHQEFLVYGTDVESFEAIDDTHLRLVTKKTIPGVIERLLSNGSISIVNKEWFETSTDEEKQLDPACTGPYVLTENVSGSKIVVTANDNYWKTDESMFNPIEKRNVKTIDMRVNTEETMRAIALENKEVDFASISSANLNRFTENGAAKDGYVVELLSGSGNAINCTFLNMDPNGDSPFAHDINLRKAALYALNSEDIMYALGFTNETASVLKGFGSRAADGYQEEWDDPEYDYFNYDPEKAHEFYKASGHADGEVEIKMLTTMAVPDSVRAVMMENLTEAGFKVKNIAVEQALYLTYRFESDQWDLNYELKLSGENIVTGWDNLFNPAAYTNGSVCFTHDDKLVELLDAAVKDATSKDNINAFNDYLKDQAICKAFFESKSIVVAQDGILEMAKGVNGFLPEGSVYAADYTSAPGLVD